MPDRNHLLAIYLDDHWAGAGAGVALAWRLHRNNLGSPWADRLASLARQIQADDETLADLRAVLGVDGGKAKRRLAQAAERVARLKPNGRLLTYSPLSRVLEVEALVSGIEGKRRLWAALRTSIDRLPAAGGFDFERLEQRAGEQLAMYWDFHREAAERAFSP